MSRLPSTYNEKMLREIANDAITPKKSDKKVQNDLYEDDGLDYDDQTMIITS